MFRSPPQPMWDLTIHSPSGPSVLTDTRSLLQSMWDPSIHPLVGTPARVHPLQGSASLLAHHTVSGFGTICNGPSLLSTASKYCPLWIFPFRFSLKVFKTRVLGRGFLTLIKNVSFSSPTDMGSHNPPPFGT